MEYKKISRGFNIHKLIALDENYQQNVEKFIKQDENSDYYESLYNFTEEHRQKFETEKTLAGVTGLFTNRIVFDFDSQVLESARQQSLEMFGRLVNKGVDPDQVKIFFSGAKGFHLELDVAERLTQKEVKNIVKNLAEGLTHVDTKILDENRIFRLPLTINKKTGNYKIPLTPDQLSTAPLDVIVKMSKDPENYWDHWNETMSFWDNKIHLPAGLLELKNLSEVELKLVEDNLPFEESPDFTKKPKHLSAAKFALCEGFFEAGERHEAYMILASTYRTLGYNKEIAYNMLKATNRLQSRRTGQEAFSTDELWNNVVGYVFSDRWKGGNYAESENSLLQKTILKFELDKQLEPEERKLFVTTEEMVNKSFEFLKNLDQNRVFTGIKQLDENMILTKGMLVGIVGAPGSGKTSLANNLVEYTSMGGNNVFYHSFDMQEEMLTIKMVGKYCGYSLKKMKDIIKEGTEDKKIEAAKLQFHENFRNVGFNFHAGFTVEQVRESIIKYKDSCGGKLTLVVVDYLEKIHTPYPDPTAGGAYVVSRLADMAKELNVCIVVLLQPNKMSGSVSEPILSYISVKGSSVIQQDCRALISLWRPGYNPEHIELDKYTSVAILKQNMGNLGKFNFMWDPFAGTIKDMTEEERHEYDHDMETIKKIKNNKEPDLEIF